VNTIDLVVVVVWLALTFVAGVWFGRMGSKSTEGFFVADRNLPWWVVGTSMVATTFAADTPLVVSGYVASGGIAANWKWWWLGAAGVTSVYLFAHLWRRTGVITDAQLSELRYDGRVATTLRGVQAVWFGVFMNLLVIAWVMAAMRKVLRTVLPMPELGWLGVAPDVWIVLGLFVLTVVYTGAAGMMGVVATDVLQFGMAMLGSVVLAVLAWQHAGGLAGMQEGFARHGLDWEATTALWPMPDASPDGAFAQTSVLMGVIWWSSKQIDGGGYLAQRLFAARDDRHAVWGYLWFTVANLCVRPWPWIVVGLAGMATFGPLDDPELYYPRMMSEVLPVGAFGLLLAAFLAAFMSTVDTQLHWGASLVVNDLWLRFLRPGASNEEAMLASRLAVLGLALVGAVLAFYVDSLGGAWELAFSVTAGLGTVYIARWYWWRTNAWSEVTAMAVAAVGTFGFRALRVSHPGAGGEAVWLTDVPLGWFNFPFTAGVIALVGLPLWVGVTLLTEPTPRPHLLAFYRKVRPGGAGWRAVAGEEPGFEGDGPTWRSFVGIAAGTVSVYGALLGTGALLLGRVELAVAGLCAALIGAWGAGRTLGGVGRIGPG
jgi:SSS family solute:Na+ symporter